MSIEDQVHADDAEFELFLRREDALSKQLNGLPQPSSNPALDASILVRVESALAIEAQQKITAPANDPIGPAGANVVRQRFNSLWNVPLGLAAGVALTVLVQMVWQSENPSLVAQAPPAEQAIAQASSNTLNEQVSSSDMPTPMPAPTKDAAKPSAPSRAPEKSRQIPVDIVSNAQAPRVPPILAPAAPLVLAQAEPMQEIHVTGMRAALQQSMNVKRRAESTVEEATAEDIGKMPDKNRADSLQRVPGVAVASIGKNDELDAQRAAASHVEVALADQRSKGELEEKVKIDLPRQATGIAAAPAVSRYAAKEARSNPEAASSNEQKVKTWLALIEAKLKTESPRDALGEWEKFRKVYPAYPVPDALAEKIKALQLP